MPVMFSAACVMVRLKMVPVFMSPAGCGFHCSSIESDSVVMRKRFGSVLGGRSICMEKPGTFSSTSVTGPVNPFLVPKWTGNSGISMLPSRCEKRANS